jgi:membrane protein implicated in regulation of membrane protease activity
MRQATDRPRNPIAAHPLLSAAIAILVAADIFFVLWTPIYSKLTPKLGSWPFFYWYLLIFMPVTSLALWLVTLLQKRLEQSRQDPATAAEESGVRS